MLQCVAICCSVLLQCVAVFCSFGCWRDICESDQSRKRHPPPLSGSKSVLHCVAVCCSMQHCVAV